MLKRWKDTLHCSSCGQSWDFMSAHPRGLTEGSPCPTDGCPSNKKTPLGILAAVCKAFDGNGPITVGANAALLAMKHHWKQRLATGGGMEVILSDIDGLRAHLNVMKEEILLRAAAANPEVEAAAVGEGVHSG